MEFVGEIRNFSSLIYKGFAVVIGILIFLWIVKKSLVAFQDRRKARIRSHRKIGDVDDIEASGGRKKGEKSN